jgi:enediyne biosynthesis protein CalE2
VTDPRRTALLALLEEAPVLLDGAVGTELLRRGVPTPLPLWSARALIDRPGAVAEVHRAHVRSGARVLTANTFRTTRVALAAGGMAERAEELTGIAVRLARTALMITRPMGAVLVAGSIGPVMDCYRPDLVPYDETLRLEHAMHVRNLLKAGVDLAIVETMGTIREAEAALGACRAGGLPAFVSFACRPSGDLLSGDSLRQAAHRVADFGPEAILVNCCSPVTAGLALRVLRDATLLPYGAYANGEGCPDEEQGWSLEGGSSREEYLAAAEHWLDQGARLVGGCCGTPADWIDDLAHLLRSRR